jgi:hypothetical protein
MKRWSLMCLAGVWLAGCDYTVPLVQTPAVDLDNALVGRWQKTGSADGTDQLLVLPLGKREFLVVFPAGSKDAMFARGSLWRQADLTLMQLDWFGTAQGKLPTDSRTYQYAAFDIAGDTLRVRLLNPDTVDKAAASTEALQQAILASQANPKLYRDAMTFRKIAE